MDATRVHYNPLVLLAGDIGGTKTLLGLFKRASRRPERVVSRSYRTSDFSSFGEIIGAFTKDVGTPFVVDAAVAGVAGPVVGDAARLTHVEWSVSAAEIAAQLDTSHTRLLNDLEAMAIGASVLGPEEVVELQRGAARDDGNAAVIAAGTGLGQACLHRVNSRLYPVPSAGGHADFAARTDREIQLVHMLRRLYGRAAVEHVVSRREVRGIRRWGDRAADPAGAAGWTLHQGVLRQRPHVEPSREHSRPRDPDAGGGAPGCRRVRTGDHRLILRCLQRRQQLVPIRCNLC